jgi:hypothetical protein
VNTLVTKYHLVPALLVLLLPVFSGGCRYSRWALRDEDYARRYPDRTNNILTKAAQAIDARHLFRKDGAFVAGGIHRDAQAYHGDLGVFLYPRSWYEQYAALTGLYSDDLHDAYVGGKVGCRIQPPTRLAPFVGVGGFAGAFHKGSFYDALWWAAHDEDGNPPDWNPGDDGLHPMFAVYPEAGVHYWLSSRTRVTASLSYLISSEGRDFDYLLIGLGISRINSDSDYRPPIDFVPSATAPDEELLVRRLPPVDDEPAR